ncbi:MalY/PatB family protein [Marinibacterium sp. SX1]|uniref:MalY/PatB family protein n=1 Tax=Marinibacterium sp. SX1 TaxID=3388424 RepID=UPI003D1628E5
MTTDPDFDAVIDRRGTGCAKWDAMDKLYGVSPDEGLSMWVADMDFRPPQVVLDRGRALLDDGIFGYTTGDAGFHQAVSWWMENRHGWTVAPETMFTTTGIVNAVALCLDTFTRPGDGIVLFTPVYHAFAKTILGADRRVVECEMPIVDGLYTLDFDAWDAQMDGSETALILCSPHNPGGRVWTRAELEGIAAFARRHDLLLISDEIHHDLVMPGQQHVPTALIDGVTDRLVTLAAPSKTFNLAGLHTGCVIIEDEALRAKFASRKEALRVASNVFGVEFATAAYSPAGAEWVEALVRYLDGNRQVFDAGINAIPGLRSMPLQATYLSWVDFAGTGMSPEEAQQRVYKGARIAANEGHTFGKGGDSFLRFNIGMPRSQIEKAVERMAAAFEDLQ